ncbi:metallophosphoesterase [Pedobacter sp. KBW01]|uniref:metallophosphoesterase n=1 Tax=Pedobacter sp. KBW01 TaxID=2153364 RepID=UPI001319C07B|nr:metallophosphoesterase [Pedobacter sp. KBW01]
MKKIICYLITFFAFSLSIACAQQKNGLRDKAITIQGAITSGTESLKKSNLYIYSVDTTAYVYEPRRILATVNRTIFKYAFSSSHPVFIEGEYLPTEANTIMYLAEPGDSVILKRSNAELVFIGEGAEKYNLIRNLTSKRFASKSLYKSLPAIYKPFTSVEDFKIWNDSLNVKMNGGLDLIESYKFKISPLAYDVIKSSFLQDIEKRRLDSFSPLLSWAYTDNDNKRLEKGISHAEISKLYDIAFVNPATKWLEFESNYLGDPYFIYRKSEFDALREKERWFKSNERDSSIFGNEKADGYVYRYNMIKRKYKGIQREKALAFFFYYNRGAIYRLGFIPKLELMLADYYQSSAGLKYKKVVSAYEHERRRVLARTGLMDFELNDRNEKIVTKNDFLGKVVVLDFWFTGCTGCVQMAPAISIVEDYFRGNKDVVFVSVSIDKDKDTWLTSVNQGKYTSKNSLQLFTKGLGTQHPLIKYYDITAYPSLLFFDAFGNLLSPEEKVDPRRDNGKGLINLINKQLAEINDGPYVFDENGQKTAFTLKGLKKDGSDVSQLSIQSDEFLKRFNITLQNKINVQPFSFKKADKLVALSDIEGNMEKLKLLLINNGIVDENCNWTFGNGHLVFCGDMFDRGNQVTECLWLIYSLEDKAKKMGGYVHFILGNHEIMNLQGDVSYNTRKYANTAKVLGKSIAELYSENSELGKWLRSKNVVEQIGDLVFAHGGISSKINIAGLGIEEINKLARPNYALKRADYGDANTNLVMDTNYGPFWYRGYYGEKRTAEALVDSVLAQYKARHIITGHTIIADTISTLYHNKVINTDVPHAKGKSEALLILGNSFYRVNDKGQRWLLFRDEDKVPVEGK